MGTPNKLIHLRHRFVNSRPAADEVAALQAAGAVVEAEGLAKPATTTCIGSSDGSRTYYQGKISRRCLRRDDENCLPTAVRRSPAIPSRPETFDGHQAPHTNTWSIIKTALIQTRPTTTFACRFRRRRVLGWSTVENGCSVPPASPAGTADLGKKRGRTVR